MLFRFLRREQSKHSSFSHYHSSRISEDLLHRLVSPERKDSVPVNLADRFKSKEAMMTLELSTRKKLQEVVTTSSTPKDNRRAQHQNSPAKGRKDMMHNYKVSNLKLDSSVHEFQPRSKPGCKRFMICLRTHINWFSVLIRTQGDATDQT